MSEQFTLLAERRTDVGKGASRRLRREQNSIPAIIYGGGKTAETLTLAHKDVLQALQYEAFFSSILSIQINGNKKDEKVILKAMQRHPSKTRILHMDFLRVSASEKLTLNVPLHLVGEDVAIGVKQDGGIINKQLGELEVKCLPANLPEYIEVDVSQLRIEQAIHISDIKLPKGVELATAIEDDAHDHAVVSIVMPKIVADSEATSTVADADEEPSTEKNNSQS